MEFPQNLLLFRQCAASNAKQRLDDDVLKLKTYKNYTADAKYSAEDGCYIGHIADIHDIVGFQCNTPEELEKTFRESVDDYLDTCRKAGKKPDKPVRVISLRVPQKARTAIATAAKRRGQSINGWAADVLRRAARA